MAAHLNCLELLGFTGKDKIEKVLKWAQNRSVTLRFKVEGKNNSYFFFYKKQNPTEK